MGAASAYQAARRGLKVLGIDQFQPPHKRGSSHGETRITREAIGEGSQFVGLAKRSQQLWRTIEALSGETLFQACGALILGSENQAGPLHGQNNFLEATITQARQFNIEHQIMNAETVARQHPQFAVRGDETGYYEPGAGYLRPESAISAQLALAQAAGAQLLLGEKACWRPDHSAHCVVAGGRRYYADKVVLAAGPWLPDIVPALRQQLAVRRQVLFWFALDGTVSYERYQTPVFIWNWGCGENEVFYGFPTLGTDADIKVASEQTIEDTHADTVNRQVSEREGQHFFDRHLATRLRGVTPCLTKAATCLYTCTPSANFIVDWHPEHRNALVISACSGHGFKHSAAIGEAVAEMIESDATPTSLLPFSWPG